MAKVHRLVLEAFVGTCPPEMETMHLNGCRSDNRLENLKWGTHEENIDGLRTLDVIAIKHGLLLNVTQRQLADYFGVSRGTISDIATGKTWKDV